MIRDQYSVAGSDLSQVRAQFVLQLFDTDGFHFAHAYMVATSSYLINPWGKFDFAPGPGGRRFSAALLRRAAALGEGGVPTRAKGAMRLSAPNPPRT
jgi:hypothetical protein